MSKVTYEYDEGSFGDSSLAQNISPVQHDNTNYSSSFVSGRGNLTSSTRWDVNYPTNSSYAITSTVKYNTAGSAVAQITPWTGSTTKTVKIGYSDTFNSSGSYNTYAYPTSVTDPASHSLTMTYRYDIGANVETAHPHAYGQTYGKTSKTIFDSSGRLDRQSVYIGTTERSYARYEYPTNGIETNTYSTIADTDGDNDIAEEEVLTHKWMDGAGRVTISRVPHNGSNYAATKTEYDALGRVTRVSVPTEVDSGGTPAGDDVTRGFIWNAREYDWKGRVTRLIPSDSTGSDNKDSLISYDGCGCAGGQVTTIKGPVTTALDVSGTLQTTKRRTQKVYEDILGRTIKAENWDLDGAGTDPYSTVVSAYNARDQITSTIQYGGGTGSSVHQENTATYDGLGRLYTSHKPEQFNSTPSSPTYTTYAYNKDSSISSVTDGRGTVANYEYNSIGLLTGISYSVPSGSGITVPGDIDFTYDDLGNRLTMTDGLGNVSYVYNELSQVTSETRQFNDTLADAPLSSNRFQLTYSYDKIGNLKSYTDPYGKEIDYTQDKLGRLSAITGSSFGGVTAYSNNPVYSAWGAIKHVDYGDGLKMDVTYDKGLRPDTFQVKDPGDSSRNKFDRTYSYFPDGQLDLADEVGGTNHFVNRLDRSFTYDHMGRVATALSGAEATGGTETNLFYLPYHEVLYHDALDNLTGRDTNLWNYTHTDWSFSYAITNNRIGGYTYDKDGKLTLGDEVSFAYDAAGNTEKTWRDNSYETLLYTDGDGIRAKKSQRTWDDVHSVWESWESGYYFYSSVLKEVVSDIGPTGKKKTTYVIANGIVARQGVDGTNTETVGWQHTDPVGLSYRSATFSGGGINDEADVSEEQDAMENNVGVIGAFNTHIKPKNTLSSGEHVPFGNMETGDCVVDGLSGGPCGSPDSTTQCPHNYCGARTYTDPDGHRRISPGFASYGSGRSGFLYYGWHTNGDVIGDNGIIEDIGLWAVDAGGPHISNNPLPQPPWNIRFILDRLKAQLQNQPSVGPGTWTPPPPPEEKPPCVHLGLGGPGVPQIGVQISGFVGAGAGDGAVVDAGAVGAADFNGGTVSFFGAPYGGIWGGPGNAQGEGAPHRRGQAYGAAASVGPSLFISTATDPTQQQGEFENATVATPIITVSVARDPSNHNVRNLSIGGPSFGLGYFKYHTYTGNARVMETGIPCDP